LDGSFAKLSAGVAAGDYVVWLGSGVSLRRVAGLKGVVRNVLEFLRVRVDPLLGADCPHRRALTKLLVLASLDPEDVDLTQPVSSWTQEPGLVDALVGKYAVMLDTRVRGEKHDYLLWEAVDVVATYADPALEPDVEHYCLAILALEGLLPEIASANWDGLVEVAMRRLGGAAASLTVCVIPEDFRAPLSRTRLMKFHGCAVLAAQDEAVGRPRLIGRQSQITDWPNNNESGVMVDQLVALAATRRTLMLGLSAQDSDIQDVFSRAKSRMAWTWPDERPAHVFAEATLGPMQSNILRVVYGDAYDQQPEEVEAGAHFPGYAQMLLFGLALHTVFAKLEAFVLTVDAPALDDNDRAELARGIRTLRDTVAEACKDDLTAALKTGLAGYERVVSTFRGEVGDPATTRYRPLSAVPVQQVPLEPSLATSGVRELGAALSLLARGAAAHGWILSTAAAATAPAASMTVTSSIGATPLYLCATGEDAVRLEAEGAFGPGSEKSIILFSRQPVAAQPRSPRRSPGRTGRLEPREVGVAELLRTAANMTDLDELFIAGAVL